MREGLALLRLCQLVSPAMPVGAYNFSQGLEYAAERGWVRDEVSAGEWIGGVARQSVGTLDLPILLRLHQAWTLGDLPAVQVWSQRLLAARESAELRAEERHMGRALAKVLIELDIPEARGWLRRDDASYAALFALAAVKGGVSATDTAQGYLWAWAENQVIGAVKLLPIGQSAGQRMLNRILLEIPQMVIDATCLPDADIGMATPLQAMASAWHETQYTRLFRS